MFALVTGANGLLGRNLTAELLRRGHRVRTLDLKPMTDRPEGAEALTGDIRNVDTARSACEGIDVVFHLAALLPQARASEETFSSVNVRGTENMLSAAVSESARRFVFSSSVEIYGIPDRVPCTEDAPKKLLGTYSRNKLDCEELCARYSADFGIEVVMMRMPMIFGPGYWHEKFYLRMFEDLGRGKPIRIIGDGGNRHQVVACSDVAEACILAAEVPGAAGEAFNIASDPATVPTVRQTAERVIRRVRSKSQIKCVKRTLARALIRLMSAVGRPMLLDEHREVPFVDYVFDIEKAGHVLGYAPRKDNVEAIAETVEWYWESKGLSPQE
ncbi:MAG: NAD(P)-dependent oxidoreductase [Candidatus Hydrogenedentota bacterium]|nr:MAG: NAD(P)-dependent oxidoreductase [Candidatus Hydrogenedentota bacterium]